jgi:hypothetical protein
VTRERVPRLPKEVIAQKGEACNQNINEHPHIESDKHSKHPNFRSNKLSNHLISIIGIIIDHVKIESLSPERSLPIEKKVRLPIQTRYMNVLWFTQVISQVSDANM